MQWLFIADWLNFKRYHIFRKPDKLTFLGLTREEVNNDSQRNHGATG